LHGLRYQVRSFCQRCASVAYLQFSDLEHASAFEDGVFRDVISFFLVSPNCPFSSSLPELLPSSLCFAVISFPSSIVHVRPCNFRGLICISGNFVWMRLNFSPSCLKAQGSNSGSDHLCFTDIFFVTSRISAINKYINFVTVASLNGPMSRS
jgi:hypothetical protein